MPSVGKALHHRHLRQPTLHASVAGRCAARLELRFAAAVCAILVGAIAAPQALAGSPTFSGPTVSSARHPVNGVAVGDVDGDAKPDVVAALTQSIFSDSAQGFTSLLRGDGLGGLGPPEERSAGLSSTDVAVGNLNGDGFADAVTVHHGSHNISVFLGSASGLTETYAYSTGSGSGYSGSSPWGAAITDVNGDLVNDVLVTNGPVRAAGKIAVFLGNGDGSLRPPVEYAAETGADGSVRGLAVGDLNDDGIPDAATSIWNSPQGISVLLNDGRGVFTLRTTLAQRVAPSRRAAAISDLNGDRHGDIAAVTGGDDTVNLYYGDGTGAFTTSVLAAGACDARAVAAGDLNLDGDPDLAVTCAYNPRLLVFYREAGAFTLSSTTYPVQENPDSIAIADLTRDGKPDIVVGNQYSETVSVLVNTTPRPNRAPRASFTVAPASGTTATPFAFDGTGSSDPDGDPLTYAWSFGDGAVATGATTTHTYALPGTYTATLTVSDGRGGSASTTRSIAVTQAPAPNAAPSASFGYSPSAPTVGETVAFSNSSTDPDGDSLTSAWSFGDGATSTATSPTHAYSAPGSYTVTLTVSDGRGATSTASRSVSVSAPSSSPEPQPQPPQPEPQPQPGQPVSRHLVRVEVAGGGLLRTADGAIFCGGRCSATFPAGAEVVLEAIPDSQSTLASWRGGGCAGLAPTCALTVAGPGLTVSAAFRKRRTTDPVVLSATTEGAGSAATWEWGLENLPLDCGAACARRYALGTFVRIVAVPRPGSTFARWGGGCAGQGSWCTVRMDRSRQVHAVFTSNLRRP